MQQACVILSAASLAAQSVSKISHKHHDFRKKVTEHKMCVLVFSTILSANTSHTKKHSARYCYKCENVFVQNTRYSNRILMKLEFYRYIFEKTTPESNLIKILSVEAVLLHAYRQTDMTKLIAAFRSFANRTQNRIFTINNRLIVHSKNRLLIV